MSAKLERELLGAARGRPSRKGADGEAASRTAAWRDAAWASARAALHRRLAPFVVPIVLIALTNCSTGGPTDEEKARMAARSDALFGPLTQLGPGPPRGASASAASMSARGTVAEADGSIETAFAEREVDCSLTETFVDEAQQLVVRREPDLDLRLHAAARLPGTAGVYPGGCSERVLGIASVTAVVAGRRAGGEVFGATTMLDEDGTLRVFASQNRTALVELKAIVTRPPASAYELESLATADVNGDAINDLVVALADFSIANGNGKVAVLRGKGKGKFAAPVFLALPFPARGVTIADLTGDQHPDIVAVGQAASGSTLASFKNLGNGTFAAAVAAPQGAQGNRVIAADLDGDLKLDVATSGGQWLRGKGDGTFEAPVATGWLGRTLASDDFDRDGVLDVAVAGADGGTQVAIYLGLGGGAFARGEVYAGTFDPESLVVSEIDGDGNLDLVIGLASGGLYAPTDGAGSITSFLLGRGDGSFAGVPVRDGVVAAVADFDGDGMKDLLTAKDASSTRFRLFRGKNKKKLTFRAPTTFDESFAIVDLATGKLDANASIDFVALARGASVSDPATLHVRLRQGAGFSGGDDETLGFAPTAGAARSIALGDFNRDGKLDVALVGSRTTGVPRPGVLVVLLGAGNGTLGPPSTIEANLLNPMSLVATDLDGTGGNEDLVLIERGDPFAFPPKPGSTRVYAGKGNGAFAAPIVLGDVENPEALAVADVNGDGSRDVLVAGLDGSSGNTLQVSLRRLSGRFASATVKQLVQFATTGIAVADLDLDGKPDAVLTGCCGVAFTGVLLGKGNGKFGSEAFLPQEVAGARPELVDIDGDGRPELLLSSEARAGIALLRNVAGGS